MLECSLAMCPGGPGSVRIDPADISVFAAVHDIQAAVLFFGVSADAETSESVQTWPGPNLTMNVAILGPTSEILPPYIATQSLRGDDYLEWCLRWNKSQQAAATQRAVPPKVIRGRTTTRAS